jgi:hypothetical protein
MGLDMSAGDLCGELKRAAAASNAVKAVRWTSPTSFATDSTKAGTAAAAAVSEVVNLTVVLVLLVFDIEGSLCRRLCAFVNSWIRPLPHVVRRLHPLNFWILASAQLLHQMVGFVGVV